MYPMYPSLLGGTFNPISPLEQFSTPKWLGMLGGGKCHSAAIPVRRGTWTKPRHSSRSRCCGSMLAACDQGVHAMAIVPGFPSEKS